MEEQMNYPGLDRDKVSVCQHPNTMREQLKEMGKAFGLSINKTKLCSCYGLGGKLNNGSLFGFDGDKLVAVAPYWYETRNGKKYYYLSKFITQPPKVYLIE